MTTSPSEKQLRIKAEKEANGLKYGLVAGLAFAMTAWLYDAWLLHQAAAEMAWDKLAIGVVVSIMIGAAAGWLSARLNRSSLSFFTWALAGIALAWVASHLPFNGISLALGFLDPLYRASSAYPFVESAQVRMILLYVVVGGTAGLGGVLEMFVVDAATKAEFFWGRVIPFGLCFVVYGIAGLAADNLINSPLREPLLAVDQLFRNRQAAEVNPVSVEIQREQHLRALDPLSTWINSPRRLSLGEYDPQALDQISVNIQFEDGTWGRCQALVSEVTFCQRGEDLFSKRLACVLAGDSEDNCMLYLADEAYGPVQVLAKQVEPQPQIKILSQRGELAFLEVQRPTGAPVICRLRSARGITVEACDFPNGEVQVYPTRPPTTASLPTQAVPTATRPAPTPTVELVSAAPVLIPEMESTLPAELAQAPHYTITVNVDYTALTYQGHAQIQYTNAEAVTLDKIYLRLLPNGGGSYGNGAIAVSQTQVNGQAVTAQLSINNSVEEVPLAKPLNPGDTTLLDLDFSARIPRDYGSNPISPGYGIFNFTDNVLALADWYPLLAVYDQEGWNLDPVSPIGDSVYADMAYYTVDLTTHKDLVLASTGVSTDRQDSGETSRYHLVSGPAREFFMVMSPDFKVKSQVVEGVTVRSYYLPGHVRGGEEALKVASRSLHIYNDRFGRYPYGELEVVEAPLNNASGVEYPGVVLIGTTLYPNPSDPSFAVTVAHEVAHQWWYNIVGNDVFEEPWLDEALTSYSSALYYRDTNNPGGESGLVDYWDQRYQDWLKSHNDEAVTQPLTYFETLSDPRAYGRIVYAKGALFFNALKDEIGPEAFFAALKNYFETYRFRIASGQDLLKLFSQAAGRPLDDFYQKWLH